MTPTTSPATGGSMATGSFATGSSIATGSFATGSSIATGSSFATGGSTSGGAGSSKKPVTAKSTTDPILRNALRYTISAPEYEALHRFVLSRSKVLKKSAPSPAHVERLIQPGTGAGSRAGDDYNAAAVRASVRVFLASSAGLKLWAFIKRKLTKSQEKAKGSLWQSADFRLSLSISSILLLNRLLYRFFTRFRGQLLSPDAQPWRNRNPRTSAVFTSPLAPAVGASLAGFLLGVYPSDQFRLTVTIYILTRASEFAYNHAENEGWIWDKEGSKWQRPWWWGSWLLFPPACGQLLHASVFDRDCFPKAYGDFIMRFSPQYVQKRPADYPDNLPWPDAYEILDNVQRMAKRKWPAFVSPILFPNHVLPEDFATTKPITSTAQPTITALSCALLHPHDPSCLRTYASYWIQVFPQLAKFFGVVYGVLSLPKWRQFVKAPIPSLDRLVRSVLRISTVLAGAIGTSWASVCMFQSLLPGNTLATQRIFLGGFLGGLWGFLMREGGRSNFLYGMRSSMESLWKVGVKRGWWRPVKGGDLWLVVMSWAVINVIYDRDPQAITSSGMRRIVAGMRGEGLVDVLKKDKGKAVAGNDGEKRE